MNHDLEAAVLNLESTSGTEKKQAWALLRQNPEETRCFLVKSLQTNPGIRWRVLIAMRMLEVDISDASEMIAAHLKDKNRLCRLEAARVLEKIGKRAQPAERLMWDALEYNDFSVINIILKILHSFDDNQVPVDAPTYLKKLLRQQFGASRPEVAFSTLIDLFVRAGLPGATALTDCICSLVGSKQICLTDDADLLQSIFRTLGTLGASADSIVPRIARLLDTQLPPQVEGAVIECLGNIRPGDPGLIRRFLKCLLRRDGMLEEDVLRFTVHDILATCMKVGSDDRTWIPALVDVLLDVSDPSREYAIFVLHNVCTPDTYAGLEYQSPLQSYVVCMALVGSMPRLVQVLDKANLSLAEEMLSSLKNIGELLSNVRFTAIPEARCDHDREMFEKNIELCLRSVSKFRDTENAKTKELAEETISVLKAAAQKFRHETRPLADRSTGSKSWIP